MAPDTRFSAADLEGKPVYSSEGEKVGNVAAVFLDEQTQQPEWLAVEKGILGAKQMLVPVAEAVLRGDEILVPHSEVQIEGAPAPEGRDVSQTTERALARHYGLAYSEQESDTGLPEGRRPQPPRRAAAPGATVVGERPDSHQRRNIGETTPHREGRTRDELYAEARRLGIEGRSKMKKAELARAIEEHRASRDAAGGSSGRTTARANPIEVQAFLEAVDYPTRKADLVREAERQGAPEEVRATLERIRDAKFDAPTDVSKAIGGFP